MADDVEARRQRAVDKLQASVAAAERAEHAIDSSDGSDDWVPEAESAGAAMREAIEALYEWALTGGDPAVPVASPAVDDPPHVDTNWWFRAALLLLALAFIVAAFAVWG